jgi:hypothetical protein
MLHFMPSSPPILPSICPCSHASCLPHLAVVLPHVLRCLSFLSRHCLLPSGTSICPPLVALLPLFLPLIFAGVIASCLPWLVVVSPLITPLPSVCMRLCLSSHRRLSLCPSHAICSAGCPVAYQYIVHKHNKKERYCKFFGSLADELINNTQGLCMTRTAIKNQAAEAVEAAKPPTLR